MDGAAHDGLVAAKPVAPAVVAEHHIRARARSRVVRRVKESAQIRTHTEHVKVVAAHLVTPHGLRSTRGLQSHIREPVHGQSGKRRIAVAQVPVVRVGVRQGDEALPMRMLQNEHALGVGKIQGPQQQRVQHAEDDHVRADAERQGDNGGERKAGRMAQLAQCISKVLQECPHGQPLGNAENNCTFRATSRGA